MADRIQQRRDTAARWEQFNPILLEGEVGYVTDDPNLYKIGDGVHAWNDLPLRGFDGTLVQQVGNSTNTVMSQNAVNKMNLNEFILKSVRIKDAESVEGIVTNSALLKEDGTVATGYDHWYLHEIHSPQINNRIYYVEFTPWSAIAEGFVTVGIYRESDNSVVALYNPQGRTVVAFRPQFYIKIVTNYVNGGTSIVGGTSIIHDTDALDTVEENLESNEETSDTALSIAKSLAYKGARTNKTVISVDNLSNGYYGINGILNTSMANYKNSGKISINANYRYYVNTITNGSVPLCVFFDSSDNFIGYYEQGSNSETKKYAKFPVVIPAEANYMYVNVSTVPSANIPFTPITIEYINEDNAYQELEPTFLTESYHFFRPNLVDLINPTNVEDYEIGTLGAPLGFIESNHDDYRIYTIKNTNEINRFLYIKATVRDGIPISFCNVMLLEEDSDKVLSYYRLQGTVILAIQKGVYAKVNIRQENYIYGVQTSYDVKDLHSTLAEINDAMMSYTLVEGTEAGTNGYYLQNSGEFVEYAGYKSVSFDVDETKDYYLTSVVNGQSTALAVFMGDSNNYLGKQAQGTNSLTEYYTNEKLILPKGTAKILCSTLDSYQTALRRIQLKVGTPNTLDNFNDTLMNLNNYQWVRTGIDLDGRITDVEEYEVGALTRLGKADSFHTYYRTYTIKNENTTNQFLFIRANLIGNLPITYCSVVILSETDDSVVFHARLHGTQIIAIQKGYYAKICQSSNYGVQTSFSWKDKNTADLSVLNSYWKGKKGAWFGTSIPAQGYPINCGNYLEMTMNNEAKGSSMCRAGRKAHTPDDPLGDVYGVTGVAWQNICYSLSLNQAEKHDIFINWTTERRKANLKSKGYQDNQLTNVVGFANLMSGDFYGEEGDETVISPSSKPIDIMTDNYISFRKKCYADCWNNSTDIESGFGEIKGRVQKYLDWNNTVDLWVLDHGHNDNLSSDNYEDYTTVPDDPYDRWTFLGAMNFIIKQIYDFNPRARIVIIGHYENTTENYKRICDGQEILAAYWNIPIYKCWENFQMAKARVITTNAYWDTSGNWHDSGYDGTNGNTDWRNDSSVPENPRQENGVWVHDMTMLRVWMKDALHPGSAPAKDYYGRLCALFIKNNI